MGLVVGNRALGYSHPMKKPGVSGFHSPMSSLFPRHRPSELASIRTLDFLYVAGALPAAGRMDCGWQLVSGASRPESDPVGRGRRAAPTCRQRRARPMKSQFPKSLREPEFLPKRLSRRRLGFGPLGHEFQDEVARSIRGRPPPLPASPLRQHWIGMAPLTPLTKSAARPNSHPEIGTTTRHAGPLPTYRCRRRCR